MSADTHSTPPDLRLPDPDSSRMPPRIAAVLGLVAFAYTLLAGLVQTDNAFVTIVLRAIVAMIGTVIVGHIVGWIAQAMLNENVRTAEQNLRKEAEPENSSKESTTDGR
jgi:hypothetical protein